MHVRCFVMVAVLVCVTAVPLDAQSVRLAEVSGRIEVLRQGQTAWQACHSGTAVVSGDRLRCGRDGAAVMVYGDGTNLRIKGETYLQILDSGYRLRSGSTWVRVSKQGAGFKTFTPNAVVSVRGTAYSVSTHRRAADLSNDVAGATGSATFLHAIPRAHLAGAALVMALLEGRNAVSEVKVFQGNVAVEALWAAGPQHEYVLSAGRLLVVDGPVVDGFSTLVVDDYKTWSIEFRRRFMEAVPTLPGQEDFDDGSSVLPAAGTVGTVRLLNRDSSR